MRVHTVLQHAPPQRVVAVASLLLLMVISSCVTAATLQVSSSAPYATLSYSAATYDSVTLDVTGAPYCTISLLTLTVNGPVTITSPSHCIILVSNTVVAFGNITIFNALNTSVTLVGSNVTFLPSPFSSTALMSGVSLMGTTSCAAVSAALPNKLSILSSVVGGSVVHTAQAAVVVNVTCGAMELNINQSTIGADAVDLSQSSVADVVRFATSATSAAASVGHRLVIDSSSIFATYCSSLSSTSSSGGSAALLAVRGTYAPFALVSITNATLSAPRTVVIGAASAARLHAIRFVPWLNASSSSVTITLLNVTMNVASTASTSRNPGISVVGVGFDQGVLAGVMTVSRNTISIDSNRSEATTFAVDGTAYGVLAGGPITLSNMSGSLTMDGNVITVVGSEASGMCLLTTANCDVSGGTTVSMSNNTVTATAVNRSATGIYVGAPLVGGRTTLSVMGNTLTTNSLLYQARSLDFTYTVLTFASVAISNNVATATGGTVAVAIRLYSGVQNILACSVTANTLTATSGRSSFRVAAAECYGLAVFRAVANVTNMTVSRNVMVVSGTDGTLNAFSIQAAVSTVTNLVVSNNTMSLVSGVDAVTAPPTLRAFYTGASLAAVAYVTFNQNTISVLTNVAISTSSSPSTATVQGIYVSFVALTNVPLFEISSNTVTVAPGAAYVAGTVTSTNCVAIDVEFSGTVTQATSSWSNAINYNTLSVVSGSCTMTPSASAGIQLMIDPNVLTLPGNGYFKVLYNSISVGSGASAATNAAALAFNPVAFSTKPTRMSIFGNTARAASASVAPTFLAGSFSTLSTGCFVGFQCNYVGSRALASTDVMSNAALSLTLNSPQDMHFYVCLSRTKSPSRSDSFPSTETKSVSHGTKTLSNEVSASRSGPSRSVSITMSRSSSLSLSGSRPRSMSITPSRSGSVTFSGSTPRSESRSTTLSKSFSNEATPSFASWSTSRATPTLSVTDSGTATLTRSVDPSNTWRSSSPSKSSSGEVTASDTHKATRSKTQPTRSSSQPRSMSVSKSPEKSQSHTQSLSDTSRRISPSLTWSRTPDSTATRSRSTSRSFSAEASLTLSPASRSHVASRTLSLSSSLSSKRTVSTSHSNEGTETLKTASTTKGSFTKSRTRQSISLSDTKERTSTRTSSNEPSMSKSSSHTMTRRTPTQGHTGTGSFSPLRTVSATTTRSRTKSPPPTHTRSASSEITATLSKSPPPTRSRTRTPTAPKTGSSTLSCEVTATVSVSPPPTHTKSFDATTSKTDTVTPPPTHTKSFDATMSSSSSRTPPPTTTRTKHTATATRSKSLTRSKTRPPTPTKPPTTSPSAALSGTRTRSGPTRTASTTISDGTRSWTRTAPLTVSFTVVTRTLSRTFPSQEVTQSKHTASPSSTPNGTWSAEATVTKTYAEALASNPLASLGAALGGAGALGILASGPTAASMVTRVALVSVLQYCGGPPGPDGAPFPLSPWPGYVAGPDDNMAAYRGAIVAAVVMALLAILLAVVVGVLRRGASLRREFLAFREATRNDEPPVLILQEDPLELPEEAPLPPPPFPFPPLPELMWDVERQGYVITVALGAGFVLHPSLVYTGAVLLTRHWHTPSETSDFTLGLGALVLGLLGALAPLAQYVLLHMAQSFVFWPEVVVAERDHETKAVIPPHPILPLIAYRQGFAVLNVHIRGDIAVALRVKARSPFDDFDEDRPCWIAKPRLSAFLLIPRGQWYLRRDGNSKDCFPFQYHLLDPARPLRPAAHRLAQSSQLSALWRRVGVIAVAPYAGRTVNPFIEVEDGSSSSSSETNKGRKLSRREALIRLTPKKLAMIAAAAKDWRSWRATLAQVAFAVETSGLLVTAFVVGFSPGLFSCDLGATIVAVVASLVAGYHLVAAPILVPIAQVTTTLVAVTTAGAAWCMALAGNAPDPHSPTDVRRTKPYYEYAGYFAIAAICVALVGTMVGAVVAVFRWRARVAFQPVYIHRRPLRRQTLSTPEGDDGVELATDEDDDINPSLDAFREVTRDEIQRDLSAREALRTFEQAYATTDPPPPQPSSGGVQSTMPAPAHTLLVVPSGHGSETGSSSFGTVAFATEPLDTIRPAPVLPLREAQPPVLPPVVARRVDPMPAASYTKFQWTPVAASGSEGLVAPVRIHTTHPQPQQQRRAASSAHRGPEFAWDVAFEDDEEDDDFSAFDAASAALAMPPRPSRDLRDDLL